LNKRLKAIEAKLPAPEDLQATATQAFLSSLAYEELCALHGIAERKEAGIEPTLKEQAYCNDVVRRHTLGKHDKYFAEIESHERP